MQRDKIVYLVCFGFGAGVLWRSFLRVDWHAVFLILLACALGMVFCFIIARARWSIFIAIFVLVFFAGILRFHLADVPAPADFEARVGQKISISGIITDDPAKSAIDVKFTLEAEGQGSQTGIVMFMNKDQGYQYGDEIEVSGTLEKPKNFMTDQGLEFDYVNYLRKDGIFYTMHNPKATLLSSGHGSVIKRALFSIKDRFEAVISQAMPVPESTVMEGIILGDRAGFSPELRQTFVDTGTIHVVTIGGYHVALVAQWIMKIFGFLPRYFGMGVGMFSMFLYVILTGGAQTSIRAAIMAGLGLLAQATGRIYTAGRALVVAAVVMVCINPFVLAYDVSFQLSFMATIAIIFLSPRFEMHLKWISWKWLRDIVAISCAMYVFALPFILYRMGILSLVALPANILIVPLLPLTMITGFITGLAGLVSSAFAFIPGKIATLLLYYQISAIGTLARLPFAALAIQNFPLALVLIIYAIFFWIFFRGYGRVLRLLTLIVPLLLTLLAAGFLYYGHYASNQNAASQLQEVFASAAAQDPTGVFVPDDMAKFSDCKIDGPYPDYACTPGAVFPDATVPQICVKGYTASVRSVSTSLRKKVFAEYGMGYPQPRGAYEIDHFIPLALAGSNSIANLFPEAAEPTPGFHDKDVVEVFLQEEVCGGHIGLAAAQRQIATDWLAVYNNMTPEQIQAIKKKYGGTNE